MKQTRAHKIHAVALTGSIVAWFSPRARQKSPRLDDPTIRFDSLRLLREAAPNRADMLAIEPPDSHYLDAASGWLDLGNPQEAAAELWRISPKLQSHPAVLEILWRIHIEQHRWADALHVARLLIRIVPDQPIGWIGQSFALHEMHRTREALENLLPLVSRFPRVSTIPYNLACYACQLGDPVGAQRWLRKAMKLKDRAEIKRMALEDRDLQPLWPQIKEL